jgi:non-ribosomal peptide synthase protein (TIGR01720 family)
VSFDYLGRMDAAPGHSPSFVWTHEPPGPTRAPRGRRRDVLEVRGVVAGGVLEVTWTYSERLHRQETVARVAGDFLDRLRALLAPSPAPPDDVRDPRF